MVERKEADTSTTAVSSDQTGLLSQKQPQNILMDTKGIDIMKKCYSLFESEDIDTIMQYFTEDAIIECFAGDEVPFRGTGRSRDYIKNHYFGKMLAKYDYKEFKYDQFEYFVGMSGDQRTVHTHILGKGFLKDEDKRPFIENSSHTFFFDNNWKVTRYREVCCMNYKNW